jgi:two-component system, NarL family, sensor histidine kinase UhpB
MSTSLILGKSLREHIGGRWAISLLAYAVNAPLNLLSIGSNANSADGDSQAWAWLLIAAIGYLALGVVVLLADVTIFRNRRVAPMPIAAVIGLGAVAGATRGAVVGLLAAQSFESQSMPGVIATRIVTGTVLGAILIPVAALVLSVIFTYRTQRLELLQERAQLESERLRVEGGSEVMRLALVESVQADLEEVVRTRDPELARAISHRMWEAVETAPAPQMHWRAVLRASLVHNPYPILPVVTIWALSAWGTLTTTIGALRAILQIAFSVAMIAVAFSIARRRMRTSQRDSGGLFIVVMLALVIVTGPIASWIFDPRGLPTGMSLIIVNAVWLPTLTLLLGIAISALRSSEDVLVTLQRQVGDAEVAAWAAQEESTRIRKQLATSLHGSVQSRLLAAASLMRQPSVVTDIGMEDPAILLSSLLGKLDTRVDVDERSLRVRLAEVVHPWEALMSITTVSTCEPDADTREQIVHVVEEGLSNAYRHGAATAVSCSVTMREGHVVISVRDNGSDTAETSTAGIGSALLESIAPGAWTLRRRDSGGCELLVTL